MKKQQSSMEPPRFTVCLVTLFTPADETESLVGDLLEEFSRVARESGGASAREWFRRQALRTVVDLVASGIRDAPWTILVAAAGFLLIGFASQSWAHAMRTFLDAHRMYESQPGAYLFWLKFPLEDGRILLCAAVGALVALAAKRREMAAAMTLAAFEMALFLAAAFAVIASGHEWVHWFMSMAWWNSLCALGMVAGGAAVRTRRSGTKRRSTVG